MADDEALRRLASGVAAWNDYRVASPGKQDLTHIEMRNANYRGANFADTDFDGASFSHCDFEGATFVHARLNGIAASRTTFRGADLRGVELKGATDVKHVCLRGCDLRGATAFDFRVRHSDLSGLNLDDAVLELVHVYNCDLRKASLKGIKTEHVAFKRVVIEPTRVDSLAAAGIAVQLPNLPTESEWVDWDRVDLGRAADATPFIVHDGRAYWISDGRWDFFISHASVDKDAVARPLAMALATRGQRVWYDELEVKVGDSLTRTIEFGTTASLFGVVVLSKAFFGRRWTEEEWAALSRKRLFLVLHGVTPEQLCALRPGLEDYAFARSDSGVEAIADALITAIRQPPRAG